jgi:hypothetical protein
LKKVLHPTIKYYQKFLYIGETQKKKNIMKIKKLNEIQGLPSESEIEGKVNMNKNRQIVRSRLNSIDIREELKQKVDELMQIIEKL